LLDTGTFSGLGQVGAQPRRGLHERLRVAIHALDIFQPAAARHQVLLHAQLDLTADLEVGGEEHVQRDLDGALPRVFHRHHAEIGVARFHFLEHFFDAGQRQAQCRAAEVLEHGLLAEGAFRAEVADLQRLLLGKAGRHDFAEHMHQHFVAERAFVAVHHHAQHLGFAFGAVIVHGGGQLALGLADLVGELRAFGDQRLDAAVDVVDLGTHIGQDRGGGGRQGVSLGLGRLQRGLGRSSRGRLGGGCLGLGGFGGHQGFQLQWGGGRPGKVESVSRCAAENRA
jgi:hypothetical protein